MERTTLANRPETLPPKVRIEDFLHEGIAARVFLKLKDAGADTLRVTAQAYQLDPVTGLFVNAPDGRPSRTNETEHGVHTSGLNDTHRLHPGWTRIVGDYDENTFQSDAVFANGKPAEGQEPDWATNPTGQHFDLDTGKGYRWGTGELLRIAEGKVEELYRLLQVSAPVMEIDF